MAFHPPNGVSLEDCLTNTFILAETCSLRWRRYRAHPLIPVIPEQDPVLSTYSSLLEAGFLCAWQKSKEVISRSNDETPPKCEKELWVFWYDKEPKELKDKIHVDLTGNDTTNEEVIKYEYKTIFYKALHNAIERHLLKQNYVRLDRWFLKPLDNVSDFHSNKEHFSFCFSFFLHGDSNVCASVDITRHFPIRRITCQHIALASRNPNGLHVMLAPHCLKATLTGVSYKTDDPHIVQLLEEWNRYYPIKYSNPNIECETASLNCGSGATVTGCTSNVNTKCGSGKSGCFTSGSSSEGSGDVDENSYTPAAVEVLVGDVVMCYPSWMVVIASSDDPLLKFHLEKQNVIEKNNSNAKESTFVPSFITQAGKVSKRKGALLTSTNVDKNALLIIDSSLKEYSETIEHDRLHKTQNNSSNFSSFPRSLQNFSRICVCCNSRTSRRNFTTSRKEKYSSLHSLHNFHLRNCRMNKGNNVNTSDNSVESNSTSNSLQTAASYNNSMQNQINMTCGSKESARGSVKSEFSVSSNGFKENSGDTDSSVEAKDTQQKNVNNIDPISYPIINELLGSGPNPSPRSMSLDEDHTNTNSNKLKDSFDCNSTCTMNCPLKTELSNHDQQSVQGNQSEDCDQFEQQLKNGTDQYQLRKNFYNGRFNSATTNSTCAQTPTPSSSSSYVTPSSNSNESAVDFAAKSSIKPPKLDKLRQSWSLLDSSYSAGQVAENNSTSWQCDLNALSSYKTSLNRSVLDRIGLNQLNYSLNGPQSVMDSVYDFDDCIDFFDPFSNDFQSSNSAALTTTTGRKRGGGVKRGGYGRGKDPANQVNKKGPAKGKKKSKNDTEVAPGVEAPISSSNGTLMDSNANLNNIAMNVINKSKPQMANNSTNKHVFGTAAFSPSSCSPSNTGLTTPKSLEMTKAEFVENTFESSEEEEDNIIDSATYLGSFACEQDQQPPSVKQPDSVELARMFPTPPSNNPPEMCPSISALTGGVSSPQTSLGSTVNHNSNSSDISNRLMMSQQPHLYGNLLNNGGPLSDSNMAELNLVLAAAGLQTRTLLVPELENNSSMSNPINIDQSNVSPMQDLRSPSEEASDSWTCVVRLNKVASYEQSDDYDWLKLSSNIFANTDVDNTVLLSSIQSKKWRPGSNTTNCMDVRQLKKKKGLKYSVGGRTNTSRYLELENQFDKNLSRQRARKLGEAGSSFNAQLERRNGANELNSSSTTASQLNLSLSLTNNHNSCSSNTHSNNNSANQSFENVTHFGMTPQSVANSQSPATPRSVQLHTPGGSNSAIGAPFSHGGGAPTDINSPMSSQSMAPRTPYETGMHGVMSCGYPTSIGGPLSSSSSAQLRPPNSVSSFGGTHSLLVNLYLSDSLLNLFTDINFDSCVICNCHMTIQSQDASLHLNGTPLALDTSKSENQKCDCGFRALRNRHLATDAGLFGEDEFEVASRTTYSREKTLIPFGSCSKLIQLINDQLTSICSLLPKLNTTAFFAIDNRFSKNVKPIKLQYNQRELDGRLSLKEAMQFSRFTVENPVPASAIDVKKLKFDDWLLQRDHSIIYTTDGLLCKSMAIAVSAIGREVKDVCTHLLSGILSSSSSIGSGLSSSVNVSSLGDLSSKKFEGPLTWAQFYKNSGQVMAQDVKPLPIPSFLVSNNDYQSISVTPFALPHWEKLLLEPFSGSRSILYVAICPEDNFIVESTKVFLKELSSVYHNCQLGLHVAAQFCSTDNNCNDSESRNSCYPINGILTVPSEKQTKNHTLNSNNNTNYFTSPVTAEAAPPPIPEGGPDPDWWNTLTNNSQRKESLLSFVNNCQTKLPELLSKVSMNANVAAAASFRSNFSGSQVDLNGINGGSGANVKDEFGYSNQDIGSTQSYLNSLKNDMHNGYSAVHSPFKEPLSGTMHQQNFKTEDNQWSQQQKQQHQLQAAANQQQNMIVNNSNAFNNNFDQKGAGNLPLLQNGSFLPNGLNNRNISANVQEPTLVVYMVDAFSCSMNGFQCSSSNTNGSGRSNAANNINALHNTSSSSGLSSHSSFSSTSSHSNASMTASSLAYLKTFEHIKEKLPENVRKNCIVQLIPLSSITSFTNWRTYSISRKMLKEYCFAVYSKSSTNLLRHVPCKSLTTFGPCSDKREKSSKYSLGDIKYTPPFVLHSTKPSAVNCTVFDSSSTNNKSAANNNSNNKMGELSYKDSLTSSSFNFNVNGSGMSSLSSGYECKVLYVTYCLSHDHRCILVTCTDHIGQILHVNTINIEISVPPPHQSTNAAAAAANSKKRSAAKMTSVRDERRRPGLEKLWEFVLSVISKSAMPWRVVIGRFGRLGHGEIKDWHIILSKESLMKYSQTLKNLCTTCKLQGDSCCATILSACLVSLESAAHLQIFYDSHRSSGLFGNDVLTGSGFSSSNKKNSHQSSSSSINNHSSNSSLFSGINLLTHKGEISCTHVLVFPTSANTSLNAAPQQGGFDMGDTLESLFFDPVDEILDEILNIDQMPSGTGISSSQNDNDSAFSAKKGVCNAYLIPSNGDTAESQYLQQQPMALGFYVSTASVGKLPSWFWSANPLAEFRNPVTLKAALHIATSLNDDRQNQSHPLDSTQTTTVLRHVLETYNSLSWLNIDPASNCSDRNSCLPIHMSVLMNMYHCFEKFSNLSMPTLPAPSQLPSSHSHSQSLTTPHTAAVTPKIPPQSQSMPAKSPLTPNSNQPQPSPHTWNWNTHEILNQDVKSKRVLSSPVTSVSKTTSLINGSASLSVANSSFLHYT